jgi:hypothetical protein
MHARIIPLNASRTNTIPAVLFGLDGQCGHTFEHICVDIPGTNQTLRMAKMNVGAEYLRVDILHVGDLAILTKDITPRPTKPGYCPVSDGVKVYYSPEPANGELCEGSYISALDFRNECLPVLAGAHWPGYPWTDDKELCVPVLVYLYGIIRPLIQSAACLAHPHDSYMYVEPMRYSCPVDWPRKL